jgi:hypothetical protein
MQCSSLQRPANAADQQCYGDAKSISVRCSRGSYVYEKCNRLLIREDHHPGLTQLGQAALFLIGLNCYIGWCFHRHRQFIFCMCIRALYANAEGSMPLLICRVGWVIRVEQKL